MQQDIEGRKDEGRLLREELLQLKTIEEDHKI